MAGKTVRENPAADVQPPLVLRLAKQNERLLGRVAVLILAAAAVAVCWKSYSRMIERRAHSVLNEALAAADAGELGRAAEQLERLVSQYPRSRHGRDSLFYLGEVKYREGDSSGALNAYNRYVAAGPDGRWAAAARVGAAYSLEGGGDLEGACGEFRRAYEEDIEGVWAMDAQFGEARCEASLGRTSRARVVYEKMLESAEAPDLVMILEERLGALEAAPREGNGSS